MTSKTRDNWERLVKATLDREQLKELSLLSSPSSRGSSRSSSSRQHASALPADVSDTTIDHRDLKTMLALDKQKVAWRSASMRFSLDSKTGKDSFVLGERLLFSRYSFVEWTRYRPTSSSSSSSSIEAQMSPETFYAAQPVFCLTKSRTANDENFRSAMAASRLAEGGNGVDAARGDDACMEIQIRIDRGENGEVEASLLKIDKTKGLVVGGTEFRSETPVHSKEQRKGTAKGFFSRPSCELLAKEALSPWTCCSPHRLDMICGRT